MPPPYLRLKKMLLFASAASPPRPRLDGLRLQVAGASSGSWLAAGCGLLSFRLRLLPSANRLAGADVNISKANFAELK
jgi:hypothetical protein